MEERAASLRCYSRLSRLLFERRMSVTELGSGLARRGIRVNPKTLYRLADPTASIERMDMTVAGEICKLLEIDLSTLVSFEAASREGGLQKLSMAKQRKLDALLERQAESRLPDRDRAELVELVEEAERLTLRNARTLARARHASSRR